MKYLIKMGRMWSKWIHRTWDSKKKRYGSTHAIVAFQRWYRFTRPWLCSNETIFMPFIDSWHLAWQPNVVYWLHLKMRNLFQKRMLPFPKIYLVNITSSTKHNRGMTFVCKCDYWCLIVVYPFHCWWTLLNYRPHQ